ncbi:MAG: HD domain-containing phosphohydrolase [Ilumatobacter sp.]
MSDTLLTTATTAAQRWERQAWRAHVVRALAFLVPLVGSVAAGLLLATILPSPTTTTGAVIRWSFIALVSTAALVAIERVARRLVPLSILFKLTLAFPDRVPSRLGLALRGGTTTQLARRIEEASTGAHDETAGEAAHRLLELVTLLSRHDSLTRGHSERVRGYAQVIGAEMGIEGQELEQLRWAALLHDVGKIRVPRAILNKGGRLTDDEFDVVKTHPMAGRRCVEPLADWLGEAARAVWEHHERFDGSGYPQGLKGTEIARAARIVSVADAYDVMTSARSYKPPMSAAEARAELSKHAGTQFNPEVVRAVMRASIGAPRTTSRASAASAHVAFLPAALVTNLGSVLAVGAAVAVGSAAGTIGIVAAQRPATEQPAGRQDQVQTTFDDAGATDDAVDGQGAGPVVPARSASDDLDADPDRSPTPSSTTTVAAPEDAVPTGESPTEEVGGPTTTTPTNAGPRVTPPATVPQPVPTARSAAPGAPPPTVTSPTSPAPVVPTSIAEGPPPAPTPTTRPGEPVVSVPPITVPVISVPPITVPVVSVPPITVPLVPLPPITVPVISLPPIALPVISLPPITLPPISRPPLLGP